MTELLLVLLGLCIGLAGVALFLRYYGFQGQNPSDYAHQGPELDIRKHLNGPIICEGVLYGPIGRVNARFVADFDASWDGNTGVMKEHFRYDSGTTQDREWTLHWHTDGRVTATAADIIGEAVGEQNGPSLVLRYRIKLPASAGGHVLDVTDWMYVVETGTIVNRSQFRKFGLKVAELVAVMRPHHSQFLEEEPKEAA